MPGRSPPAPANLNEGQQGNNESALKFLSTIPKPGKNETNNHPNRIHQNREHRQFPGYKPRLGVADNAIGSKLQEERIECRQKKRQEVDNRSHDQSVFAQTLVGFWGIHSLKITAYQRVLQKLP